MKWKVLISAPYMLPLSAGHRSRLEANDVEIIAVPVRERLEEDELLPVVTALDGVVCGDDRFSARVLEAAPRLRVISKCGTGLDSIDRAAAARLGIKVCNTPGAFSDAVADTVLGYILCFARRLPWQDRRVRERRWEKLPCSHSGNACWGSSASATSARRSSGARSRSE